MSTAKQLNHNWTHFIRADTIPEGGQWVKLHANGNDCSDLAERLGVKSVDALEAKLHLIPKNSGYVLEIQGDLQATITQECAITLDLVESVVEDAFTAWYADYERAASFTRAQHDIRTRFEGEEQPIMEESEDPEPMVNGQVDLADLVYQFLSLAINPYTKSDAVETSDGSHIENPANTSTGNAGVLKLNPFAALKNWRPKD
ncbi:MAG: hypothetical protein RBR86_00270 [Pseudobdellovibrionaceae bacterium]|jgi:uncharacterized metal-binding protein YceD (DUF177 family)|nr:hypothetical protein [Pseudobdellovibrionaceae bacterium]